MTDDIVARLRAEGDDEAAEAIKFQEASIRRLERKLTAAEARVRELESVNAALDERAAQYERLYRNAEAETIERCATVAEEIAYEHFNAYRPEAHELVVLTAETIRQLAKEDHHAKAE